MQIGKVGEVKYFLKFMINHLRLVYVFFPVTYNLLRIDKISI